MSDSGAEVQTFFTWACSHVCALKSEEDVVKRERAQSETDGKAKEEVGVIYGGED